MSALINQLVELQFNPNISDFTENYLAKTASESSSINHEPWLWLKKKCLNPNQELEGYDAHLLVDQSSRYFSIDPHNLEYLNCALTLSNKTQPFLVKTETSIPSRSANTSGLNAPIKNQMALKSNVSRNPEISPELNYLDPFDYENAFKLDSESKVQTSDAASMYSKTRNRRAQTMVNGDIYYWEMTDFDDTSTSNDLFIFDGTDTSSYNITIEIASLNAGPPAAPRGTANDDTALGSGPNYQWGTPQNASNSWQNGNPTQSFHFMTIESDTGVLPVSNISVDSRAISYYLGNYWGHWDVSSSLSSDELDTEYRLNYYFEYTGAPEPSTYLMTSALLGLIGLNRSSRKSIILLSLRSKQFLSNCVLRVSKNS